MPTQKQTQGATAHDLEMLMSSLVPNDLGLPLLIQITLCLLQRDCTQTINADQLMHGNLFPQCNLFRGLWLRHTLLWYPYLLSSLLNNSLKPWLSKLIFLLSPKGLWIKPFSKKQSFALVIGIFPQVTALGCTKDRQLFPPPLNGPEGSSKLQYLLLTMAGFLP